MDSVMGQHRAAINRYPTPGRATWRRQDVSCRAVGSREAAKELMKIVGDTDRGMATTVQQKAAIEKCVGKLQEMGEGRKTTGLEMSAVWKMVWTTEKV